MIVRYAVIFGACPYIVFKVSVPRLVLNRKSAVFLSLLVLFPFLWLTVFPGNRSSIAFVLLTGLGRDKLQLAVDRVEADAIEQKHLSDKQRLFLVDLYRTLATGGRLSVFARQSGALMDHYLDKSGEDYQLQASIFTTNKNVQEQANLLRLKVLDSGCRELGRYESESFYMPHHSSPDSVFALYHGTVSVSNKLLGGECRMVWRAEVPWVWPSYESLQKKYGTPHGESFPIPNLRAFFFDISDSVYIDNGLGHYLETAGLAKSFLAYGTWEEIVCISNECD